MTTKTRLTHPLCGANLATLLRVVKRGGLPARQGLARYGLALGAAIGRLPFTVGERLYMAQKTRNMPPLEPPIFILGHWRSGTTHLYNILAKSEQFGSVSPFATALPWDMLSIGTLFRPLLEKSLPSHRYIDNVAVEADSPQEDEIALANMTAESYYHALYFPKDFHQFFDRGTFFKDLSKDDIHRWNKTVLSFYKKLSIDQGGRRLVIKNPVYTARPQHLARLFPGAKFIHIHRDPHRVFLSMRNFYDKLLAEFALQSYAHMDIDTLILDTYDEMMSRYINETAIFTDKQLIEVSYDALQAKPLETLETIYTQLDLPNFASDKERFERYLSSIEGYQKNSFTPSPVLTARIEARWRRYFKHWGYPLQSG